MDDRPLTVAADFDLDALLAGPVLIPVETEKLRFHGVALNMKLFIHDGVAREKKDEKVRDYPVFSGRLRRSHCACG
jgi:hypothetical protein